MRFSAVLLSGNNLRQVDHTCASVTEHYELVLLGNSQKAVMPDGWEGSCTSSVTLAMNYRHSSKWFIYQRAQSLRTGNKHLRLHASTGYGTLYHYLLLTVSMMIGSNGLVNRPLTTVTPCLKHLVSSNRPHVSERRTLVPLLTITTFFCYLFISNKNHIKTSQP